MQPEERDTGYLWNLMEAGRRIQEFTAAVTFNEYLVHQLLPSAVERQFEKMGEAARKVSATFRTEHPEIPWRRIVGLRNILTHRYYAVNDRQIWTIINDELPLVLAAVGKLIPPLPPEVDEE
jgi:uncharacterized protein with HEPN domain